MSRPLKVNFYNLYDTSANNTDVLTDSLVYYGNTSSIPSSATTGSIYLNTEAATSTWRYAGNWQPFDNNGNEIISGVSKPTTVTNGQIFLDISTGIPYWGNNGSWYTFTADKTSVFSPKDLNQLIIWFDAQDISSTDVNGSYLINFRDKIGYSCQIYRNPTGNTAGPQIVNNVTLGASVNKRWIYFNDASNTTIQFDRTNSNNIGIVGFPRYCTLYIVGVNSGSSSTARLFSIADDINLAESNERILSIGTNATANSLSILRGNGTTSEIYSAANAAPLNTPFICGVTYTTISDASNTLMASIYINGTKVTDISSSTLLKDTTGFPTKAFSIGCKYINGGGVTQPWKGYFGEVLLYVDPLLDDERQKLEGYLAWKWGIQSYLPAGHTYKNAAP